MIHVAPRSIYRKELPVFTRHSTSSPDDIVARESQSSPSRIDRIEGRTDSDRPRDWDYYNIMVTLPERSSQLPRCSIFKNYWGHLRREGLSKILFGKMSSKHDYYMNALHICIRHLYLHIQNFKRNDLSISRRSYSVRRICIWNVRIIKDRATYSEPCHLTVIKARWSRRPYTDHDNRDSHAQQLSPLIAPVVHLARRELSERSTLSSRSRIRGKRKGKRRQGGRVFVNK